MVYQRDNIYRAVCSENNPNAACIKLASVGRSIEECYAVACQDGWKLLAMRSVICPNCLKYLQSKGQKQLQG